MVGYKKMACYKTVAVYKKIAGYKKNGLLPENGWLPKNGWLQAFSLFFILRYPCPFGIGKQTHDTKCDLDLNTCQSRQF